MKTVIVCINRRANPAQPSCGMRGGSELADKLEQAIAMHGLDIRLERFACLGRCEDGPNLKLSPEGPFCSHVHPEHLESVMQEIEAFIENALPS